MCPTPHYSFLRLLSMVIFKFMCHREGTGIKYDVISGDFFHLVGLLSQRS